MTSLKRREERLTSDHMRRLEFRANRSAVPPSLRVESDAVVDAIVEAVATFTNDAVTELGPRYEAVDSEALTELATSSRARNRDVEVSFEYQDCHVTVSSRGDIVAVAADQ